jgi:outer membrane receptor protein involved in Fe transport
VYGTDYVYLEKAGSRRLPTWTNFDFSVSQDIPIGGGSAFRVEARVLNLFNSQPPLTVDQDLCTDTCTSLPVDPELLNPNFGRATSYAQPRRFFISGIFTF